MSNGKGKTTLYNILGVVLGVIGGLIAYYLATLIFALLGEIRFIAALLSWPVDFEWYALTGILFADIFVGIGICKYFCDKTEATLNYGVIVLIIINVIRYISGFVKNIVSIGFSFPLLLVYIMALGAIIVMGTSAVPNEK